MSSQVSIKLHSIEENKKKNIPSKENLKKIQPNFSRDVNLEFEFTDGPLISWDFLIKSLDTFEKMYHLTPSQLYQNLLETMNECGGIGLSANQCGVMARMFVMYTDWDNKVHEAFFNPEIMQFWW